MGSSSSKPSSSSTYRTSTYTSSDLHRSATSSSPAHSTASFDGHNGWTTTSSSSNSQFGSQARATASYVPSVPPKTTTVSSTSYVPSGRRKPTATTSSFQTQSSVLLQQQALLLEQAARNSRKQVRSQVARKISQSNKPMSGKASNPASSKTLSPDEEKTLAIAIAVTLLNGHVRNGMPDSHIKAVTDALKIESKWVQEVCQKFPDFLRFNKDTRFVELVAHESLKLCYNYAAGNCSKGDDCPRFHLCVRWLHNKCDKPNCPLEHQVIGVSKHNIPIVDSVLGIDWDENMVKRLLLSLEPHLHSVCNYYNTPAGCKHGDTCKFFHICSKFVDRKCRYAGGKPGACRLNHRVHHCENRKKLLEICGRKWFDDHDQLISRLALRMGQAPKELNINDLIPKGAAVTRGSGQNMNQQSGQPRNKRPAWYFLDNDKTWKLQGGSVENMTFGLHVSQILEDAFQAKEMQSLVLEIGQYKYSYDFDLLEQTNMSTLVRRKIKREMVQIRQDAPISWMPMISDGDRAVLFPLEKTNSEFTKISFWFNAAGANVPGSSILEIYRVQNTFLKKMFDEKKAELSRLYRPHEKTVDEKLLFHGTDPSVLKNICEQNFDWRRHGEASGNVYGHGAYFAKKPSYSHNYCKESSDGSRYLFVANVLVGLYTVGNSSMKYPPAWKGTIQYDTSVDNVTNPSIFVKYDSHDYYPAYIVHYTG